MSLEFLGMTCKTTLGARWAHDPAGPFADRPYSGHRPNPLKDDVYETILYYTVFYYTIVEINMNEFTQPFVLTFMTI